MSCQESTSVSGHLSCHIHSDLARGCGDWITSLSSGFAGPSFSHNEIPYYKLFLFLIYITVRTLYKVVVVVVMRVIHCPCPFEVVRGLDHERAEDSSAVMMVPSCGGEEGIQSKISPGYFLGLSTPPILLYRAWNMS